MAAVCFPKPEVEITQPWIEISKFAMRVHLELLKKRVPSLNTQPEIELRRHGRHLEKIGMTS